MQTPSLEITPPPGGVSASFASLTGVPGDNAALAAALGGKLNTSGGTLTGLLSFSGTTHAGLRLNNLTTTQRNAIASPTAGMTMWNTTTARMNVHNGTGWTDGFVRLAGDAMTGKLTITQGTANDSVLASTGYSLTGSNAQSLIDLAGTWNTSGTPTAFNLNITDTASNATSNFAAFQIGGVTRVGFPKRGAVVFPDSSTVALTSPGVGNWSGSLGIFGTSGTLVATASSTGINFSSSVSLSINGDLFLSRRAAASLRLGADSATPVAQTLGISAGVGTNIAGANFSIGAGTGTGSGNPGSLLFQTSSTLGSGSTAQTLATRLSIGETEVTLASGMILRLGNTAVAATPAATHTVTARDSAGTTMRILVAIP